MGEGEVIKVEEDSTPVEEGGVAMKRVQDSATTVTHPGTQGTRASN